MAYKSAGFAAGGWVFSPAGLTAEAVPVDGAEALSEGARATGSNAAPVWEMGAVDAADGCTGNAAAG